MESPKATGVSPPQHPPLDEDEREEIGSARARVPVSQPKSGARREEGSAAGSGLSKAHRSGVSSDRAPAPLFFAVRVACRISADTPRAGAQSAPAGIRPELSGCRRPRRPRRDLPKRDQP